MARHAGNQKGKIQSSARQNAGRPALWPEMEEWLGRWWNVALVFLIVTLLFTLPLIFHLGSLIPGTFSNHYGDIFIEIWQFWSAKFQLLDLHANPFRFDMISAPFSQYSLFALHKYPEIMLPFTALFGPVVSLNLFTLGNFLLGGLLTWLLVRELTGRNIPGLFAGFFLAFSPYAWARALVHLSLAPLWSFPLLFYALLRWHREKTLRHALLIFLGIILLLAYSHPYYYLFFPLAAGAYLLVLFINSFFYDFNAGRRIQGAFSRISPRRKILAAGAALAVVIAGIVIYKLYLEKTAGMVVRPVHWQERFKLSWANYLLPGVDHPWFGKFTGALVPIRRNVTESTAYTGWVPLLLALWGARRDWRAWLFIVFGLAGLLITLGPYLTVGALHIPLPSLWLHKVAPFIRAVGRYAVFVQLAIAVLAGYGLADLLRRQPKKAAFDLFLAGLALLVTVEFLHPVQTTSVADRTDQAPALYKKLSETEPGAIIFEYPPCASTGMQNSDYFYFQTLHKHRLFNRWYDVTNIPPEYFPFWQDLDYPGALTDPLNVKLLKYFGVEYVAFHDRKGTETQSLATPEISKVEGLELVENYGTEALYRVTADSASVLPVFDTRPLYNYSEVPQELPPDKGFEAVQVAGAGESRLGWRVMLEQGRISLRNLLGTPQRVELTAMAVSLGMTRTLRVSTEGQTLADQKIETSPGKIIIGPLELPASGVLELGLSCLEGGSPLNSATGNVKATIALSRIDVVPAGE